MKISLVFGVFVCLLEIVVVTEAFFKLKHIASGQVAEAYAGTFEGWSGKLVRIWDDAANRAEEQTWYITYDSSLNDCYYGYSLRNKKYPGMVLGLAFTSGTGNWGLPSFKDEQPEACHKRWHISGTIVMNLSTNPLGGKVLTLKDGVTTNGNQVLVKDPDQSTDQEWSMETVYFLIKHTPSGKVVQVCDTGSCTVGESVELHTLQQGADRQLWFWDGKYIRNKWQDGKVLDFVSISYEQHGWGMVFMNSVNSPETDNQKWNMEPNGLTSDYNGLGLRLDLYEGQTADGTAVGCYNPHGGSNQQFELVCV